MDARQYYRFNKWNHKNQPARTDFICKGLWAGKTGRELVDLWEDYFNEYLAHSWAGHGIDSYWVLKAVANDALATLFLHDMQLPGCYASAEDFQFDLRRATFAALNFITGYSQQHGWL